MAERNHSSDSRKGHSMNHPKSYALRVYNPANLLVNEFHPKGSVAKEYKVSRSTMQNYLNVNKLFINKKEPSGFCYYLIGC